MISNLNGIPIYIDDSMKQVRRHLYKHWHHRRNYHKRIQKKWRKRFGMELVMKNGEIFQSSQTFFMNSTTYNDLKAKIDAQENKESSPRIP